MRSTTLLFPVLLAACGGSPQQPVAGPQNTAPEHAAATTTALGCDGAMQAGTGGVHGITTSKTDGTIVIGVTLVATSPAVQGETTISDEHGCYFFALPPGGYRITAYYTDVTAEQQVTIKDGEIGEAPVAIEVEESDIVHIGVDPPPPASH